MSDVTLGTQQLKGGLRRARGLSVLGNLIQVVAAGAVLALIVRMLTVHYGAYPRWDLLAVCGVLALCLALMAWCGTGARRAALADVYASAVAVARRAGPDDAPQSALPARLPRRARMYNRGWRGLLSAAVIVPCLGLLLFQLPERSDRVAAMMAGGSVVRQAPIVTTWNVESHDGQRKSTYYTAEARVRVTGSSGADETRTAAVRTSDRPQAGDRVWVLYAPDRPELGAVSDDRDDLLELREGGVAPLATVVGWSVTGAIVLLLVLLLRYANGGGVRRRIRRIDGRGHAVRVHVVEGAAYSKHTGAILGSARSQYESGTDLSSVPTSAEKQIAPCLVVKAAGTDLPFVLEPYVSGPHTGAALATEEAWLYLKQPPEPRESSSDDAQPNAARHRSMVHAVLIGDSGWLLRGQLPTSAAEAVAAHGAHPATGAGPEVAHEGPVTDRRRTVREVDLHQAWPALLRTPALGCAGAALLSLAAYFVLGPGMPQMTAVIALALSLCAYPYAYRSYRDEPAERVASQVT